MTDPTQAKQVRLSHGKTTRRYSWPPRPPHEFTVTSVTSAIKGGLPAPHLIGWAAKVTAECAVADHDIVAAMLAKKDKRAALSHIKGARNRSMGEKADRGTIVHAAIDAYLKGKPLTNEELNKKLDEAHLDGQMRTSTAGMICGFMEFLWDAEPEIRLNESTLYSREHQYAGTADIGALLWIDGGRNPAIVDVKTSKSIYDEVALQLSAYSRADFVGHQDGREQPMAELFDGQPIQHGVVIRPKSDGSYERADFRLGDEVFALFLACKGVAEGVDNNVLAEARITNR